MTEWTARREDWDASKDDARSAFEIDNSRVIHSASFRRLQGKTQIHNLGDSDFYRTRLTHSMEVSQVSYGIVQQLEKFDEVAPHLPSQSLIQTIGLIHDLGHPPFGHGGEYALNYCMRDHGGFEGNGQTLRILSRLEKFSQTAGSNLTRRTLLGCLKYPISYQAANNPDVIPSKAANSGALHLLDKKACRPPKCYLESEQDVVDWILEDLSSTDRKAFTSVQKNKGKHRAAIYKSLDCSIMDIADDISNGVHDLEDAISMRFIDANVFKQHITASDCEGFLEHLVAKYPEKFKEKTAYDTFIANLFSSDGTLTKWQIGRLVGYFISNIKVKDFGSTFEEPLLRYNAALPVAINDFVLRLKDFVYEQVIQSPSVQHMEFKGQQMVINVFNILSHEPKRFLEAKIYDDYKAAEASQEGSGLRIICDHIAGMTDNYLLSLYERLLSPRIGSVFDKM